MYALPTNVSGMYSLYGYANTVTNGIVGFMVLIAIFLITFFATKNYSTDRAFGYAATVVAIFSIMFRVMSFISDAVMIGCILLGVVGAIWLMTTKNY